MFSLNGFKGFRSLKPGLIDVQLGLGSLTSISLSFKPSLTSFNQGLRDPNPSLRGLV